MLTLRPDQFEIFRRPVRKRDARLLLEQLEQLGIRADLDPRTGDLRVRNALDQVTRVVYRDDGLPERLVEPSGLAHAFEYDARGRLSALIYPGGRRLEIDRNADGDITALRRPDVATYEFEYQPGSPPVVLRMPDGRELKFTWTTTDQLIRVVDRAQAETTLALSDQAKVRAVTDPLERVTVYLTNESGEVEGVAFPDGTRETYALDLETKLLTVTRRDGSQVRLGFGPKGESTRIEWNEDDALDIERGEDGSIARATRGETEVVFERDDAGRPLTETGPLGTVASEYDDEGQLVLLTLPNGEMVTYEYDDDGRLAKVVDWDGRENRFLYAYDGTLQTLQFGNGLAEARSYADPGRLAESRIVAPEGGILSRQTYHYDVCERLTDILDTWEGPPGSPWKRQLVYDDEGRILAENDSREQKRLAAFEYDAKGNLVRVNGEAVEVGLLDEPTRSGGTPLYYDGLGRMTNLREPIGKVACSWAPDGTLVEALAARHRCRYAYDPLGRRIRKTVGAVHTDYSWMGHRLLWEECHGGPDGTAPYRRDYLWTPDGVQPLAFRQDGRTYWLVCDARGAVIRALDEKGQIAWLATYDSFGVATTRIGKVSQPFRLPGHYHDEESGLHYCLARYYSPTLRSYLTPDPARLILGTSRYGYCGNDPWNRMAPCGTGMLHIADGVLPLGPLVRAVLTRMLARATLGDTVTGPVTRVAGVLASAAPAPDRLPMRTLAEGVDRSVVRAIGACLLQRARGGDPVVATAGGPPLGPAAMLDLALLRLGRIPPMRGIVRVGG